MSSGEYFLIGLVILAFIILALEWRRQQHPGEQPSFYDLLDTTRVFVAAAEQMMPGQTGNQKLTWVMASLNRAGLFNHIDSGIVRAAIEAGVYALKRGQDANAEKSGG